MKSNKQLMGIIELLEGVLIESKTLAELVSNDSGSKSVIIDKADHVLSIINEAQSSYSLRGSN